MTIAEGGVIPNIHSVLIPKGSGGGEKDPEGAVKSPKKGGGRPKKTKEEAPSQV